MKKSATKPHKLTKGQTEWRMFAQQYRENLMFKALHKSLVRESKSSVVPTVEVFHEEAA